MIAAPAQSPALPTSTTPDAVEAMFTGFTTLLLERVNPAKNEQRLYYLAWQPTLFGDGAVVRIYGRRDGRQRVMAPVPFDSLADAWPFLRALIRRRLAHGYRVVREGGSFRG